MKILFLPSYFYPEQAASSYLGDNIRTALIDQGHQVEIYTPRPSRGINNELRKKYKSIGYQESDGGLMKVHRFPMINENKKSILRVFRYFMCHFLHFYYGVRSKNIDILFIASTPPTQGGMGALVKKIKKIPMIYNLQDIFPDSLVASDLTRKGSLLWKIGRKIENFTYKNADKIIVISEGFKRT